ncbi:MAG: efflux RND transporter periplasmic adaptor subunit [Marichromatium sp.]|nr:efflux RND transporter periplasmic adaptor subunit [Marichromatium sp.]
MTALSPRPSLLLAALIALLGGALGGCDRAAAESDTTTSTPTSQPVRLFTVDTAPRSELRRFPATIEASQTSAVSFQVPGKLERFPIREGETIRAGETIAALDATDYALALREARVQADLARKELKRKQALSARGHLAENALDDARATADLAQVRLEQAAQNLAYTELEAPFDALLAERLVDRFVNVRAGEPIALLQDISVLTVEVDVPERLMARVRREQVGAITAELSAWPGRSFPLSIREFATEPDPRTRTYTITLFMTNPDDIQVLPGMTATVSAEILTTAEGTIEVPIGALDADAAGDFRVWVYDPERGQVQPRAVAVATLDGSHARILSGLAEGERIVAAGVGFLSAGQRVRPLDDTAQ